MPGQCTTAMSYLLLVFLLVSLTTSPTKAQFDIGGEESNFFAIDTLNRRMNALEANIRSGALGGCESGVIGPFSPGQNTGRIQFRGRFQTSPTVSISVAGLTVINASLPIRFQTLQPQVTTTSSLVSFVDPLNNIGAATLAYMACPNNANSPVTSTGTNLFGMSTNTNTNPNMAFNPALYYGLLDN